MNKELIFNGGDVSIGGGVMLFEGEDQSLPYIEFKKLDTKHPIGEKIDCRELADVTFVFRKIESIDVLIRKLNEVKGLFEVEGEGEKE
jgi:hypothetical protein